MSFSCTLMILHLSHMRRNVNRNVYNNQKNVSATTLRRFRPCPRTEIKSYERWRYAKRLNSTSSQRCWLNVAYPYMFLYFLEIRFFMTNNWSAVARLLEHRTPNRVYPDSNPVLLCRTLGKFFHSTLLQFIQVYGWEPGYWQRWICVYHPCISCSVAECFPQKSRW